MYVFIYTLLSIDSTLLHALSCSPKSSKVVSVYASYYLQLVYYRFVAIVITIYHIIHLFLIETTEARVKVPTQAYSIGCVDQCLVLDYMIIR